MAQWAVGLTIEPDDLTLILRIHKVEGENQLLQVQVQSLSQCKIMKGNLYHDFIYLIVYGSIYFSL